MIDLLTKYAAKLAATGLCAEGEPLFAALDDTLVWSHTGDARQPLMEGVLERLPVSALLLARPAGVYQAVLAELAARALADGSRSIIPGDCETRTFLHDLPVLDELTPEAIAAALGSRKGCVILTNGEAFVASFGTVSPEQAYVTFSSMCFATFVAYFANHLKSLRTTGISPAQRATFASTFAHITALLAPERTDPPKLAQGPFTDEDTARAALIEAGRHTVEYGLVDSYFGNISYRLPTPGADTILISQTGSSLDELAPCIDPCRLDGGSCAGLTASSEFSAHQAVYETSPARAMLHGHPRFSVILSLDCDRTGCEQEGQCHRTCPVPRSVQNQAANIDIPIVPGEVGTGPFGLCNTLPPALTSGPGGKRGVIVYGHGLFTLGAQDFRDAFQALMDVERYCREEYFRRVAALGG